MKEYTFTFNQLLFDSVSRVLTTYEEKNDKVSADDMYTVLVYIQNKMSNAEEV